MSKMHMLVGERSTPVSGRRRLVSWGWVRERLWRRLEVRSDDDGKINSTTRVYSICEYEPKLYEQLELRKPQRTITSRCRTKQARGSR